MANEPADVPDTASIIDVGERLLAQSRALLDDMAEQLAADEVEPVPAEEPDQTSS